jgi:hypothetical protein
LAVKRAALRGGLWSAAGKRVEKYLMKTLCKLFQVPEQYYYEKFIRDYSKKVDREVDFYLRNADKQYLCEVKLMGQGNPESADTIFARKSAVFIADKLSQQNKNQADELKVDWVELHEPAGYKRFNDILKKLNIPHAGFLGSLDTALDKIFSEIFL